MSNMSLTCEPVLPNEEKSSRHFGVFPKYTFKSDNERNQELETILGNRGHTSSLSGHCYSGFKSSIDRIGILVGSDISAFLITDGLEEEPTMQVEEYELPHPPNAKQLHDFRA